MNIKILLFCITTVTVVLVIGGYLLLNNVNIPVHEVTEEIK